ncbi:MaoC/PaaZ C-terminal domain-containing protein [uncultured Ferrimonas sp.]|uniref:MaoC/PaaZ C-terminal domain-containing protein n=1 Tax=uncultured Ferrimonas sp. TaxID=432640 RepID=UPI002629B74F|nr:MaoC/PaaZ C-terminal domain-containing protein [uncultured Ferrimonas sp.]
MHLDLSQQQIPSHLALMWKVFTKKTVPAELPAMTIRVADFRFDPLQLRKYNEYCGFAPDAMPLCYPFVATQSVQIKLLVDPQIPVTPLGMIHMGVSFEQLSPLDLNQSYQFELSVGEQVRGERGLEFELLGTFSANGEDVCRYRSRCFIKMDGPKPTTRPARERRVNREWQTLTELQLDASQARGYARLSGDFNPIHLHRMLSKPFGFDEPIAHGMYMVAKVLSKAPNGVSFAAFEFKRPALLPISGAVEGCDGALRFVNSKRKPLLECSYH